MVGNSQIDDAATSQNTISSGDQRARRVRKAADLGAPRATADRTAAHFATARENRPCGRQIRITIMMV